MAQILNIPGPGAQLASMIGQGLGTGLQQLAQNKLEQLQQKQQAGRTSTGLQALGFTPQEAQNISLLPPNIQSDIVKNYLQAAESSGIDQALAQIRGEEAPGISGTEALTQAPTPGISGAQSVSPASLGMPEGIAPQLQTQLGSQAAQALTPSVSQLPSNIADDVKDQRLQRMLQSPRLSPEQKIKLEQLRQKRVSQKEKESLMQQKEINKETFPFYKEVLKKYRGAVKNNMRLDRMEELINSGKLSSPLFSSALKSISKGVFGFGIDLGFLQSASSQEFDKLTKDFLESLKDVFGGGRITNIEIENYLKTLPNVLQSDEAKRRVLYNLRSFNQAEVLRKNAMDKIIKENNGRRPADLESRVEELIGPKLDILAAQFTKRTSDTPEERSFLGKAYDFIKL